jgi:hypothetical protein
MATGQKQHENLTIDMFKNANLNRASKLNANAAQKLNSINQQESQASGPMQHFISTGPLNSDYSELNFINDGLNKQKQQPITSTSPSTFYLTSNNSLVDNLSNSSSLSSNLSNLAFPRGNEANSTNVNKKRLLKPKNKSSAENTINFDLTKSVLTNESETNQNLNKLKSKTVYNTRLPKDISMNMENQLEDAYADAFDNDISNETYDECNLNITKTKSSSSLSKDMLATNEGSPFLSSNKSDKSSNDLKGSITNNDLNSTGSTKKLLPQMFNNLQPKKSLTLNQTPKSNIQAQVYNFLERPTGWKCFIYHFTV